jgi:hypothetical protein
MLTNDQMGEQIARWNALLNDRGLGTVTLPEADSFALMAGFLKSVICEGDRDSERVIDEMLAVRGQRGTTALSMLLSWAWLLGRLEERREARGGKR